ncbi:MAG: YciI family protein [Chloroflexota bacterium]
MAEWIYFIHPPREDFADTMTEAEEEVWGRHWQRIKRLYAEGVIVFVGPTFGRVNTGLCVFEAPDEPAARAIMNGDPTIAEGFARGELRSMRVSLLRGRDEAWVRAEIEAPGSG